MFPADSWLVSVPASTAPAPTIDSDPPVQAAPEQEHIAPAPNIPDTPAVPAAEQRKIVLLPNTATTPPIAGLAALVLGLALTVHGLRRVRHAEAQLDRQGAALGRLATLADAEAQRRASMTDRGAYLWRPTSCSARVRRSAIAAVSPCAESSAANACW